MNKKRFHSIITAVFILAFALLAWPINIRFFSVTQEYSVKQVSSYKKIKQDEPFTQKISLQGEYLNDLAIWFDSITSEQTGDVQIDLKNSSQQVIFQQTIPLNELENRVFNKVKIGKKITPGNYSIEIKGIDCGQDYFRIGMIRNENGKKRIALNYRGRKSMNGIQTLMYWLLLFELWLLICRKGTGQGFRDRRNLGQLAVIMGAASLFCISSILSPAVTCEKSWRTLLPSFVVCGVFLALVWRLKAQTVRDKNRRKIFLPGKEQLPLVLLLLLNAIVRIPMLGTLQRWDAGEYYYRLGTACRNYQFSLQSLLDEFRLCSHSTLGFSLVAAIGEFLSPRNSVGVLIVSLVLTLLAIVCLFYLFRDAWLKCSSWLAAGLVLVISFTPVFLGTFAYVNPDYFLVIYLIFLLYCDYREWHILSFASAVLVSQCKETGVLVIAGYYGLRIAADFVTAKGGIAARIREVLNRSSIWVAMAAGAVYELLVFKLGSFTTWVQNGKAQQGTFWSNTGSNCFGFNVGYIAYKLRQFFCVNFAWIISAVVVCSVAAALFRKVFRRSDDRQKTDLVPYLGFVGAMLGFALFSVLYITARLNRYNVLFAVGWSIFGMIAYYYLFGYKRYRLLNGAVVAVFACLFLVQSFWNIDAVSVRLFAAIPISDANTILYTDTSGYLGDGLVNNYQYTWLDRTLDKLFRKIGYRSGKTIFVPLEEIAGSHFDGNTDVYDISWNLASQKRVIAAETEEETPIQTCREQWLTGSVPYKYFADDKTEEEVPENLYIPLIKYYNVDEGRVCRSLASFYYLGEKDSVQGYGGEITYFQAIKKDSYDGFSIPDVLSGHETQEELKKQDVDRQVMREIYDKLAIDEELLNLRVSRDSQRKVRAYTDERKTIQNGDIIEANIYVCEADGEKPADGIVNYPFDHQTLEIGSGQLLPGVEEALIGAEVGSTVRVECEIPEGYVPALKYEGQKLILYITPNEIQYVVEKTELEQDKKTELEQELRECRFEDVICEMAFRFDFTSMNCSEQTLEEREGEVRDYYKQYMISHDITRRQFLDEFLKIDEESYEQAIARIAQLSLCKEYMVKCLGEYPEGKE